MESDKEKGREILKKREEARKGFAPKSKADSIEETEEKEKKVAARELPIGLGARRSG